ncbi:MAG: ATP-dependent Clp protease proteolytic subunit [Nanoarchaeota archaeon]
MTHIPIVIEKTKGGERGYDIYSRLLKDSIIFIGDSIDDNLANSVIAQMLFLSLEKKEKEISIYINSPGGNVTSGMAIYDTMRYISNPIATFCLGQCASMAAVLLAAGDKGRRFSLPNSRIMIHQPWGGASGSASDIRIQANEIERLKKSINKILVDHSGKPIETVEKDTDRDFFMSPKEAIEYGLIDTVLGE